MILDFNSDKLKFSLKDVGEYNIDNIYNNIEKFKKFVNNSVISDTFEKVYNTEIFQLTLLDETTNYLDNLYITYNAIAANSCLPEITEKELKKQFIARNFKIIRTSRKVSYNSYDTAYKVVKEVIKW